MFDRSTLTGFLKLASCGAAVATLCDANHVFTHTLIYPAPFAFGQPWWVFPGFLLAFFGMATVYWMLPSVIPSKVAHSTSTTGTQISSFVETLILFAFVYLVSGFGNREPLLLSVIFYTSFALRLIFSYDRVFLLLVAIILGIGGMLGEGLMSMLNLVHYREPEILGVPYWLAALYAHGAFSLREGMRCFVYNKNPGCRPQSYGVENPSTAPGRAIEKALPLIWVVALFAACGSRTNKNSANDAEPGGATIAVSGSAYAFSMDGGHVAGGSVTIFELPEHEPAITGKDGAWEFNDLPAGIEASFVFQHPDYPEIQSNTFLLGDTKIERINFQAPDHFIYGLMANLSGVEPDDTTCQIASTVTRAIYKASGSHGEPNATVSIQPEPANYVGPIYFNLIRYDQIYPDPDLNASTEDGGVLFLNVEPGEYILRAYKADVKFREVKVKCRAGVLVNASPPWGLQVLSSGISSNPE